MEERALKTYYANDNAVSKRLDAGTISKLYACIIIPETDSASIKIQKKVGLTTTSIYEANGTKAGLMYGTNALPNYISFPTDADFYAGADGVNADIFILYT